MNPRVLFPLLTLIFLTSTCVLAFLTFRTSPIRCKRNSAMLQPSRRRRSRSSLRKNFSSYGSWRTSRRN